MPDRYAVFGDPVAHSLSPRIHALFAEQLGQQRDVDYRAERVVPARFAERVERFFADGGHGLNVTVPLKGLACELLRRRRDASLSAFALRAGAVNTIWRAADGALRADNTDGLGLLRDLRGNLGWPVGPSTLILGAGGAARAAFLALRSVTGADGPSVLVANRDPKRAARLVFELRSELDRQAPAAACGLDELARAPARFDLIVNATSAGLAGDAPSVPDSILAGALACYDLQYGAAAAPFLARARRCGVAAERLSDGLGMLVEQAAGSYALWRAARPRTAPVLRALRAVL